MGLKIDKLSDLLEMARVYVPPHKRVRDGKVQNVSGYWRNTPDHYGGTETSSTDIPSTSKEAAKIVAAFQESQIKQVYAETKKIWDASGHDAAESFDGGMTGVVAAEKGKWSSLVTPPMTNKVLGLLKGDVLSAKSLSDFVEDRVKVFRVDESNPKLRKTISEAWDRVNSQPVMRRMMDRYGTVPVLVGPGFAHPEMDKRIAENAAAENIDEIGIIYYDHTRDGHNKKMLPESDDVPKPGANVLSNSYEAVLRHEYGHTILTAESKHQTEWFVEYLRAYFSYSHQLHHEIKTSISEYSFASPQEGFSEAFSLLTNPNWNPEMIEGYNGRTKRLLNVVQELIDMEPRNLTDEYIKREKEGQTI